MKRLSLLELREMRNSENCGVEIEIPPLDPKDDHNKAVSKEGLGDRYYDKFSLKYTDLALSGIDIEVFDPNATTNNLL